ncbi:sulfatase, partial [Chloroflexota bacterium]
QTNVIPEPFLGYLHYYPPHDPYSTRREFVDAFAGDGFQPLEKPESIYSKHQFSAKQQNEQRRQYDEYILLVDSEFDRLFSYLGQSGVLENTYVIFTSDHGDMFERGIVGHNTKLITLPLVHIPLIIFEPGRTSRHDVYQTTSAVDLLPTLLSATGRKIPDWCEGEVLPPFRSGELDPDRSIFALRANDSKQFGEIEPRSAMILKGDYKLTHYYGHVELGKQGSLVEMYDIKNDPEEMVNLSESKLSIARELNDELSETIRIANERSTFEG